MTGSLVVEVEGEVVRLRGDLDAQSSPLLDEAVDVVAASGASRIVLDLAGVGFVDSSGLRSMVRARSTLERVRAPGGSDGPVDPGVVLRGPGRSTLRILEITGLTDQFVIEP